MHGIKKQEMSVWNDINYFEISGALYRFKYSVCIDEFIKHQHKIRSIDKFETPIKTTQHKLF